MMGSVDQRPESTRRGGVLELFAQKTRTEAEQEAATKFQTFGGRIVPRERLQQRQPGIFELGQLFSQDAAGKKVASDRNEPGLRRHRPAFVQFFEPFPPPGQPHCAEAWIAACRHNIRERQIQCPKRRKCRPQRAWELLECDAAVVIERAFSDR